MYWLGTYKPTRNWRHTRYQGLRIKRISHMISLSHYFSEVNLWKCKSPYSYLFSVHKEKIIDQTFSAKIINQTFSAREQRLNETAVDRQKRLNETLEEKNKKLREMSVLYYIRYRMETWSLMLDPYVNPSVLITRRGMRKSTNWINNHTEKGCHKRESTSTLRW